MGKRMPEERTMTNARGVSLALWMAASIALFVLAGSLALAWAMERRFDSEERHAFELQARSNSDFLMRSGLPFSQRMADQLGEIIGARVFFLKTGPPDVGAITGKPPRHRSISDHRVGLTPPRRRGIGCGAGACPWENRGDPRPFRR
jgi:hypothetical protein